MMRALLQPHRRQHFAGALLRLRLADFADQQRHRHVFQRVEVGQQMMELVDKAQLAVAQRRFGGRGHGVQRLAVKHHVAGGRRVQAAQQMQQRTFAGAGAADNRHQLAGLQAKGDVAQHVSLHAAFLIAFAQLAALQQRGVTHNVKPQRVERRRRARRDRASTAARRPSP